MNTRASRPTETSAALLKLLDDYAKAYESKVGAERYINSVEDDFWIRGKLREATALVESLRQQAIALATAVLGKLQTATQGKPIAKIHSDGYWTSMPGFKEPVNFASMEVYAQAGIAAAPTDELPPPDLWRDGKDIKGYTADPGKGPWYSAETVRALQAGKPQDRAEALDDEELQEFQATVEQFADDGETIAGPEKLMRWACMGLLECTHYVVTPKGAREDARKATGGAAP